MDQGERFLEELRYEEAQGDKLLEELRRDVVARLTLIESMVKSSNLYQDAVFTELQVQLAKLTDILTDIRSKIG